MGFLPSTVLIKQHKTNAKQHIKLRPSSEVETDWNLEATNMFLANSQQNPAKLSINIYIIGINNNINKNDNVT